MPLPSARAASPPFCMHLLHPCLARWLQPHFLALTAADVCEFSGCRNASRLRDFCHREERKVELNQADFKLNQAVREGETELLLPAAVEKRVIKEKKKRNKRNEIEWVLVEKQVSWPHSPSVVLEDREADTVCSLSRIWQTNERVRWLRQLCCLNICSLSPSERRAG